MCRLPLLVNSYLWHNLPVIGPLPLAFSQLFREPLDLPCVLVSLLLPLRGLLLEERASAAQLFVRCFYLSVFKAVLGKQIWKSSLLK